MNPQLEDLVEYLGTAQCFELLSREITRPIEADLHEHKKLLIEHNVVPIDFYNEIRPHQRLQDWNRYSSLRDQYVYMRGSFDAALEKLSGKGGRARESTLDTYHARVIARYIRRKSLSANFDDVARMLKHWRPRIYGRSKSRHHHVIHEAFEQIAEPLGLTPNFHFDEPLGVFEGFPFYRHDRATGSPHIVAYVDDVYQSFSERVAARRFSSLRTDRPTDWITGALTPSYLGGTGSGGGFDKSRPAICYYLRVARGDQILYKIGITGGSVESRFGSDMAHIKTLKVWEYEIGEAALMHERDVLSEFDDLRYKGQPILRSGNTELFTQDVLGLDK